MTLELRKELEASRKSTDTEDAFDVLFTDRLGMIMTQLFIKIGFTPNMVTHLSMYFGIIGSLLFYTADVRKNALGVVMEIFSAVLDCSDGQVARLTHSGSRLGRVLDGLSDGITAASIYIVLGLRLMNEPIPFSGGALWGVWIWPLVLFAGGYCHQSQCRMADYYRMVHLHFLNNTNAGELPRAKTLREELNALPESAPLGERLLLRFYCRYTGAQEARTPALQRLLEYTESCGGRIPADIAENYVSCSMCYIRLTNLLTFNLRAYTLFGMILLGIPEFFFLFVIFVLGILERIMVNRYENLAEVLLPEQGL